MHLFLTFIFGIKLYVFGTVPLSIIRSFSLYTQQWYMSVMGKLFKEGAKEKEKTLGGPI